MCPAAHFYSSPLSWLWLRLSLFHLKYCDSVLTSLFSINCLRVKIILPAAATVIFLNVNLFYKRCIKAFLGSLQPVGWSPNPLAQHTSLFITWPLFTFPVSRLMLSQCPTYPELLTGPYIVTCMRHWLCTSFSSVQNISLFILHPILHTSLFFKTQLKCLLSETFWDPSLGPNRK